MMERNTVRPLIVMLALAAPAWLARGAEFWDDRPLKIIQTDIANFPPALAMQGVHEAEARIVILVDHTGRLIDALVTGYSHPELTTEALASLRSWNYEPARQRGEPIGTRTELVLKFEARGAVLSLTSIDALAVSVNRLMATPMTSLVCRLSDLDEPPLRVQTVTPRNPSFPGRGSSRGSAAIDFYIDAEGRPRMPVVTRATNDAFGAAALDAIEQWRFAPPRRAGRPVVVRVVQEFVFTEST